MGDLGLGEGWLAAIGATLGAILLKVAEHLLARRKEAFEEGLVVQRSDQERITALWARLDAMEKDRDRLLAELRTEQQAHDALQIKYEELRLLLRGRPPPDP